MNCKKCNTPLPEGKLICQCGFLNQPEIHSHKGISSIGNPPIISAKSSMKYIISILIFIIIGFGVSQLITKTGFFSAIYGFKTQTLGIVITGFSFVLTIASIVLTSVLVKRINGTLAIVTGALLSTVGILLLSIYPSIITIILSEIFIFSGCTFLAVIGLRNNPNNVLIPIFSVILGLAISYSTNFLFELFGFKQIFVLSSILVGLLSVALIILHSLSDKTTQIDNFKKGFLIYCCSLGLLWIIFFFSILVFG